MTRTPLTECPQCGSPLEITTDADRLFCRSCGLVLGTLDAPVEGSSLAEAEADQIIDSKLAEIEDLLEETHAEIDTLRARELSGPLQLGCTFFGLFGALLSVIAVFMLLGKGYFGGWIFYICLAIVALLGIARFRRKILSRIPTEQLRQERVELEKGVAPLEAEADRLRELKTRLRSDEP